MADLPRTYAQARAESAMRFEDAIKTRCNSCGRSHLPPCRASTGRREQHAKLAYLLDEGSPLYNEEQYEALMQDWSQTEETDRSGTTQWVKERIKQDQARIQELKQVTNDLEQEMLTSTVSTTSCTQVAAVPAPIAQKSNIRKRLHDGTDYDSPSASKVASLGPAHYCDNCRRTHRGECARYPQCRNCRKRHPGECARYPQCENCRKRHLGICGRPPYCEMHQEFCSSEHPLACLLCGQHHNIRAECAVEPAHLSEQSKSVNENHKVCAACAPLYRVRSGGVAVGMVDPAGESACPHDPPCLRVVVEVDLLPLDE